MRYNRMRKITYRRWDRDGKAFPAIILQGKFLKHFGFNLGEYVRVDYFPNKIIIRQNGNDDVSVAERI